MSHAGINTSLGKRWHRDTPRGSPSTSSLTSVVVAVRPTDSTPQGPRHQSLLQLRWWLLLDPLTTPTKGLTIDIYSNFGGGSCRTRRQHPQWGPPSTSSSTSVVAAAGPARSTPKGATMYVYFNFGDDRCWTRWQHPQGSHHQRLVQLWCWLLPDRRQHP
jgi:hypothetical protein